VQRTARFQEPPERAAVDSENQIDCRVLQSAGHEWWLSCSLGEDFNVKVASATRESPFSRAREKGWG